MRALAGGVALSAVGPCSGLPSNLIVATAVQVRVRLSEPTALHGDWRLAAHRCGLEFAVGLECANAEKQIVETSIPRHGSSRGAAVMSIVRRSFPHLAGQNNWREKMEERSTEFENYMWFDS